jgi:hypothetical protein
MTQPVTSNRVAALLPGRTIYNGGVGGQTSTQIAARQGGVVPLLTLAADTIPASGPAAVTARSVSPITSQGGQATGTVNGVAGELLRAADDSYTFQRTAPGAATTVNPQTPFIIDTFGRESWINILWLGRNNAQYQTQVKADIAAAVSFLKGTPKKFLVLSVMTGTWEPKGSAGYAIFINLNNDLAAQYHDNYFDMRSYLVSKYDPTSAQDVSDFQNDLVPTSLRGDQLHLNEKGNLLVAEKIAAFIQTKGW